MIGHTKRGLLATEESSKNYCFPVFDRPNRKRKLPSE
jgi:hypothetical protein